MPALVSRGLKVLQAAIVAQFLVESGNESRRPILPRRQCDRNLPGGRVIEKTLRHCGPWHYSRAPPAHGDSVYDVHSQASANEPRELTFVAEDLIWDEAEGFLDADAFAHAPADDWHREPPGDEPQELTYVDEDTFWSEF